MTKVAQSGLQGWKLLEGMRDMMKQLANEHLELGKDLLSLNIVR